MNSFNCVDSGKRLPSTNSTPIWLNGKIVKNQYVDFLRDIEIELVDEKATFTICVDSEYTLYINGRFVDCGQYDDYPEHKAYDVLSIGSFLKKGSNRICIRAYFQGEDSMQYVTGTPMLMYSLSNGNEEFYSSSEHDLCRSAKGYTSGESVDKITMQVSFSFHYDASLDDDWLMPGYLTDENWQKPIIRNDLIERIKFYKRPVKKQLFGEIVPVKFRAQGIFSYDKNINGTLGDRMQTAFLSAREESVVFDGLSPAVPYAEKPYRLPGSIKINDSLKSVYIMLDLEDPVSGPFVLDIDTSKGTQIDVAFGEHLDDLRVRASVGGRSYAFSYICKAGRQSFSHYFRRVGGRYMQLHIYNMTAPTILYYAGIRPMYYPVENTGILNISDNLFTEIMIGCDKTLKLCMHEHYEDCPWREQGLYAMDSRNQMLSGYYMYNNSDFSLAGLSLSADNARKDGLLQNCSPSSWPTTMPSFSLEWVLSLRDFILYTGRKDDAHPLFDKAKNILIAVAKYFDGKLLVPPDEKTIWNFYEWVEGLDDYDGLYQHRTVFRQYDASLNALFCLAMDAMHSISDWLGEKWNICDDIEQCIRNNFFEAFYNPENKMISSYVDFGKHNGNHELTHAWALLANLIPDEHKDGFRKLLALGDGSLTPCTLSFCIFKYQALLQDYKYADAVFKDIAAKWGKMLYSGSKTFWETINGADDFENAGSLCHGWAGIPAYFMYAYLLGIRPTKPGYEEFVINPVPLKQTVSGNVLTPIGKISVSIENGIVVKK
ncbi:MAG: hypothetical protein E7588_01855 [Ruminococcaceae bacterium]|nr:hypothetical protein [Oscillospiraceae bacterium]